MGGNTPQGVCEADWGKEAGGGHPRGRLGESFSWALGGLLALVSVLPSHFHFLGLRQCVK